ncbi:MAG: amidohydrolase family protein [Chloroflexota bacterium]
MIIDFRLKPPIKPFSSMKIYTEIEQFDAELGEPTDPAAMQRDMKLLFREMDELGIVHAVCSGRALPDPRYSTSNDDISAAVKQYPGKFTGFAAIDPRDARKAVAETERSVKVLGLKGITLSLRFFNDPPMYADDPKLYLLYDYCQEEGIPLMLTLSNRLGRDMSYCHPLPVDHVARDFPWLTIIIQHGCWPWVTEVCGLCWSRQNVYLTTDFFGVRFPGHMEYVYAANTFLQDRILFGSAFPKRNLKLMVEANQALPFRPEVAEKYFYKNAARLLGLSD